jgi:hypothetical protein
VDSTFWTGTDYTHRRKHIDTREKLMNNFLLWLLCVVWGLYKEQAKKKRLPRHFMYSVVHIMHHTMDSTSNVSRVVGNTKCFLDSWDIVCYLLLLSFVEGKVTNNASKQLVWKQKEACHVRNRGFWRKELYSDHFYSHHTSKYSTHIILYLILHIFPGEGGEWDVRKFLFPEINSTIPTLLILGQRCFTLICFAIDNYLYVTFYFNRE